MARGPKLAIETKIAKQQEKVNALKERYNAAVAELKALEAKKDDELRAKVVDAIVESGKSLDEIMEFLNS